MFFNNLNKENTKEETKSYSEKYYESRSHQDGEYQYCDFCDHSTEFRYDRCTVCGNN